MTTIILVPMPGQTNKIGNGTAKFKSPHAPTLNPGDKWSLALSGEVANVIEIGHIAPWDSPDSLTYGGQTDDVGELTITGVCASGGTIAGGRGFLLAAGVLPKDGDFDNVGQPGTIQPFGYRYTLLAPQGPPAPPPVLDVDNLVAAIIASRQSHVRVADIRLDSEVVTYTQKPPYENQSEVVTVNSYECLGAGACARIQQFLGGSFGKADAPAFYVPFLAKNTPYPQVNYQYATIDGVPSQAVSGELAQAFDTQGDLRAAIVAAFRPV